MKGIILVLILLVLIFVAGCQKVELSELQVEACNTADKVGSCHTRLEEIGIVLPEDCCEALGKCC